LIVSLVPAIVRAGQPLDPGRTVAPVAGFTKSFDCPPDPVVITPDPACSQLDADALLRIVESFVAVQDESLPPDPTLSTADSLRAPPSAPRS
jgi:hypothetical protein